MCDFERAVCAVACVVVLAWVGGRSEECCGEMHVWRGEGRGWRGVWGCML